MADGSGYGNTCTCARVCVDVRVCDSTHTVASLCITLYHLPASEYQGPEFLFIIGTVTSRQIHYLKEAFTGNPRRSLDAWFLAYSLPGADVSFGSFKDLAQTLPVA